MPLLTPHPRAACANRHPLHIPPLLHNSGAAETGELQTAPSWVKPAGLTWPPSIQTNAFDLSFTFNFSMSDLLLLNPGLADMRTGARPALPCYPWAEPRLRPRYHGSDVALGQLAGGHQSAGLPRLAGAMAAARAVDGLPDGQQEPAGGGAYTGSLTADGGGVEQPVYFFVDTLAPFQVGGGRLGAGWGPAGCAAAPAGGTAGAAGRPSTRGHPCCLCRSPVCSSMLARSR